MTTRANNGGARDMSKRKEFHFHADNDTYSMSCAAIAKELGITAGGVWMAERYAIRELWRMGLPSFGKRGR